MCKCLARCLQVWHTWATQSASAVAMEELQGIRCKLARCQEEVQVLEGRKKQAESLVGQVKLALVIKVAQFDTLKLEGDQRDIDIAGDDLKHFSELLNTKTKELGDAELNITLAKETIVKLKEDENKALIKASEQKTTGKKLSVDCSDGIPTVALPPEGPPQPFLVCRLMASQLGPGRLVTPSCSLAFIPL